jgi:hypothetical protein
MLTGHSEYLNANLFNPLICWEIIFLPTEKQTAGEGHPPGALKNKGVS